jgi:hypothetical protein
LVSRELHSSELSGNFAYRGIQDWDGGGVLEGPVGWHLPQKAVIGEHSGGQTPGGNYSHHPVAFGMASGEFQIQNADLSGQVTGEGSASGGSLPLANMIERRVVDDAELCIEVALEPKLII